MVFDASGREVARRQIEHRQILPLAPGRVEHDPIEIAARVDETIAGALREAGLTGRDLAAIGVTNQRETAVVWDPRTGRPWHNAIVWQDTRTDALVRALAPSRTWLHERTGLPPATYFSAPKLQWMLQHVDGLREAAERGEAVFGTVDSWIVWNLTGGRDGGLHVTDVTNASRTQLMDLRTCTWDDELLELFGVPRSMLPRIGPSSSRSAFGTTRSRGPVGAEVPLAAVLGDQQAALVGQACFAPGDAKNTYGTGNFMLLNTGARPVPSASGLVTTVAYAFGEAAPVYALEGSIAVTGAAVQWLRDQLGIIRDAGEIESLASSGGRQRGHLLRAGVLRPLRPVVASRRARRHRRPVAVPHQGAPGACDARGHRLPDARRARGDGAGRRHPVRPAEGGWRGHRQRPAHAGAGRHPRRAGRAPCRHGDHGARSCVCRRTRGRRVARLRGARGTLADRSRLGAAVDRRPAGRGISRMAEGRQNKGGTYEVQVQALPLNGRQFIQLALLVPGANPGGRAVQQNAAVATESGRAASASPAAGPTTRHSCSTEPSTPTPTTTR
jgi:sugar (pentulose or hexulose) kinase